MEVIQKVEPVAHKCYSCGKSFTYAKDLERHKNRKTPCLIREVAPDQLHNPGRCIYCNKIFATRCNMLKHLSKCKIKNGGMDMLVDKVKHEQEIRILKELHDIERKEKDNIIEAKQREMDDKIQLLMAKNNELEQKFERAMNNGFNQAINNNAPVVNNAQVVNNAPVVNNNNVNNNVYNAPVQIVINNYNNPSIEGIEITAKDLINAPKMSKFLLETMFFNPNAPQNHCMYLKNKKEKSMIIHDNGNWRSVAGENVADVVLQLKNTIDFKGSELLNGKLGPYAGNDDLFTALPGADQYKIIQFNTHKDQLTQDDLNEILLDGRDTVIGTIRASGCKLV